VKDGGKDTSKAKYPGGSETSLTLGLSHKVPMEQKRHVSSHLTKFNDAR
jgi:hypothetical protein